MKNLSNPFSNKGRIISGENFIGRFEGLRTVASTVTDLAMPNNLAIIGYPRIGKSSLAYQSIIQKKDCLLSENKLAIWIDFSSISTREAFFVSLVRHSFHLLKRSVEIIGDELVQIATDILGKNKPWDDLKYDIDMYFEMVRSKGYYTIFVLDEFDEARIKFKNNTEAFRELRHLGYNAAQFGIALVTTSRRSIRDIEIQSNVSSTLDGIFGKIYLTMYNDKEMSEYYRLYEGVNIHLDENHKQRIEYYCGGHPFLLATIGFAIVESFRENQTIDIDHVHRKVQLQFSDYYEQLISLLREDNTFGNLLQIVFGPRITIKPDDIDQLTTYGLIIKGEKYFTAFSQHFQNYLKFMERQEKIEIAAWQLISQTEKGLRQLVLQVFLNTFGDNWKLGYLNRYDRLPDKKNRLHTIFARLEHAYQRDMEQYGSLAMNLTLLDETYIHQLFDYFILFSWEDLFQPIFQKEKNYWKKVKDNLELIRNPMAHQKMELLLESEIKKAEEYCREILWVIERSESA